MKKKNLNLHELKVKSFITELENVNLKGGTGETLNCWGGTLPQAYCMPTYDNDCTESIAHPCNTTQPVFTHGCPHTLELRCGTAIRSVPC